LKGYTPKQLSQVNDIPIRRHTATEEEEHISKQKEAAWKAKHARKQKITLNPKYEYFVSFIFFFFSSDSSFSFVEESPLEQNKSLLMSLYAMTKKRQYFNC
jgi:hypothetical protein